MKQDDWMSLLSGIGGNSLPPRQSHVAPSPRVHFPRPVSTRRISLAEKISALQVSQKVREILAFIDSYEMPRKWWYVGITGTPRFRLIQGHGLRPLDPRKVWNGGSEDIARRVERELLRLGIDGGTGGGSEDSPTFVYVFLKQPHTRR